MACNFNKCELIHVGYNLDGNHFNIVMKENSLGVLVDEQANSHPKCSQTVSYNIEF